MLRIRVDQGAMGAPHSPKFQRYWNLTIRLFSVISRTLVVGEGAYHSAEAQSVYSTAPDDCAIGYLLASVLQLCRDAVSVLCNLPEQLLIQLLVHLPVQLPIKLLY